MTKVTVVNNKQDSQDIDHKSGNFYIVRGGIYVLSSIDAEYMSLIGIHGNRWHESIYVEKHNEVTPEEFSLLTDGANFALLNSVTITID